MMWHVFYRLIVQPFVCLTMWALPVNHPNQKGNTVR